MGSDHGHFGNGMCPCAEPLGRSFASSCVTVVVDREVRRAVVLGVGGTTVSGRVRRSGTTTARACAGMGSTPACAERNHRVSIDKVGIRKVDERDDPTGAVPRDDRHGRLRFASARASVSFYPA